MSTAEEPVLRTERDGTTLIITIDRPKARNSVNTAVAEGIAAALDELDGDDALVAGILTGAGGFFSAGMDLKAFLRGERPHVGDRGFAGITQRPPSKPLIAAVEGPALAGGCELVLSCDLVVASEEATFGIPEVKRGLAAAAGGLMRLPARIPRTVAMELALTGDPMSAADAHRWGLVNHLTPVGGALEGARELAARIGANGPLAVRASKQVIVESPDWSSEDMWRRQGEILGPVLESEDAREGAAAFAEKRAPKWKGR
ncbi:crotonase/enoyl-CoA hydratase family protein [Actinomycetospora callitridis]|uniref:crotonase/enoyl-CoA hydratase family protein n=1 Tax=Actinomycetospora callitridis TaxID=913944 RepID=UPI002365D654|nr:crotonase/enoyl-CoA hydratase family protein [Actinomycetospora callitridis]MDD7918870.1 crotonase/enoyl-CoA hydratase family protein [Actinomycetospora callitridis]